MKQSKTPEERAKEATSLAPFAINLDETKRKVKDLLSLFGRNLIFDQYTVHDISHVDDMLRCLDWIIPKETQEILSPADWIIMVLSVYFHDLGLVVTEEEFQSRDASNFREFVEAELYGGPGGADYKANVATLPTEQQERFLYQEFVRARHAVRIRSWIMGIDHPAHGHARAQREEISILLQGLDADFRRDLALVCESHNLDDLENTEKYRLLKPYGNSDEETANLQYCATILRTVDLLQITGNRTPSALYRAINPTDPISQMEWAKQAAVKRVRAKPGTDKDGTVSKEIQSNTVEVHATFQDDNAFFALNAYLRYAQEQINTSSKLIAESAKYLEKPYLFPWRYIDEENIHVEGYIKKPFGFELDHKRILDLLTGHTLYNDSSVVIRELLQNALDAVRLYPLTENAQPSEAGKVIVKWSSTRSELVVQDNGTGMTQNIIENHLLKVGSSRYQDPKFRERYPLFSPISRFGIGILSAFMVGDFVEIVTSTPEEPEARRVSLRSVHGKYLIKLLDKRTDREALAVGPHGTSIKIRFRDGAKKIDILKTIQRWILFPGCEVKVEIDEDAPVEVGYASPKAALESYLSTPDGKVLAGQAVAKIEQKKKGGITIAYAKIFSEQFRDWIPLDGRGTRFERDTIARPPVCTCVEGVAVEFDTPGFSELGIVAIANAEGPNAPQTNVARSLIEANDRKRELARSVYQVLVDAVSEEVLRLQSEERYSLTWATEQLAYLASPITSQRLTPLYREEYLKAQEDLPSFLIETEGGREARSLKDLTRIAPFWTVESVLDSSIETVVREAKYEITARDVLAVCRGKQIGLPQEAVLRNSYLSETMLRQLTEKFEIVELHADVSDRRLHLKWDLNKSRWLKRSHLRRMLADMGGREEASALSILDEGVRYGRGANEDLMVPLGTVVERGLDRFCAVRARSVVFLKGGTVGTFFADLFAKAQASRLDFTRIVLAVEVLSLAINGTNRMDLRGFDRMARRIEQSVRPELGENLSLLRSTLEEVPIGARAVFDPLSWRLRDDDPHEELF